MLTLFEKFLYCIGIEKEEESTEPSVDYDSKSDAVISPYASMEYRFFVLLSIISMLGLLAGICRAGLFNPLAVSMTFRIVFGVLVVIWLLFVVFAVPKCLHNYWLAIVYAIFPAVLFFIWLGMKNSLWLSHRILLISAVLGILVAMYYFKWVIGKVKGIAKTARLWFCLIVGAIGSSLVPACGVFILMVMFSIPLGTVTANVVNLQDMEVDSLTSIRNYMDENPTKHDVVQNAYSKWDSLCVEEKMEYFSALLDYYVTVDYIKKDTTLRVMMMDNRLVGRVDRETGKDIQLNAVLLSKSLPVATIALLDAIENAHAQNLYGEESLTIEEIHKISGETDGSDMENEKRLMWLKMLHWVDSI